MRQILGRAITIAGEEGSEQDNEALLEPNYEAFRSVEDLTETAQSLYKAAGKSSCLFQKFPKLTSCQGHISGLSLDETVQAVYMLEQKILGWQLNQRREDEEMT